MASFILVGDGHAAAGTLGHLIGSEAQVLRVFSTPGQENRGRLTGLCAEHGIPLDDSDGLVGRATDFTSAGRPDWLINVNSTVILPPWVLALPAAGALNVHPGLLPEYAGLHTHQWAIRNGESEFGVTVHEMAPAVDTGDVVLTRRFPVEAQETGLSLYLKCMEHSLHAIRTVITDILEGEPLARMPQDLARRRLYRHRDALDGRVNFAWPATDVERFVRAGSYAPLASPSFTPAIESDTGESVEVRKASLVEEEVAQDPAPGAVTLDGSTILVACGDGYRIRLDEVSASGRVLSGGEVGQAVQPGTVLWSARSD